MAYHSSSGQIIRQGAAGLGEFFDGGPGSEPPPVHAFKEGILGSSGDSWVASMGDEPGPLMAYKEGVLGQYMQAAAGVEQAAAGLGYPLFIDGMPVEGPVTISHRPNGAGSYFSGEARPVHAFREGVLGEYFSGTSSKAPLMAYRDGSLGADGNGVLSEKSLEGVVDLQDPRVIKEFKGMMALLRPDLTQVQTADETTGMGTGYFNEAFYASPLWTQKASQLWQAVVDGMLSGGVVENADAEMFLKDSSVNGQARLWPTGLGAGTAIAMLIGGPGGGQPAYVQNNFPNLYAAFQYGVEHGGDKITVTEPFFTEDEVVKGKGMTFAGISVAYLVGGAALLGGLVYLVKKKKRP